MHQKVCSRQFQCTIHSIERVHYVTSHDASEDVNELEPSSLVPPVNYLSWLIFFFLQYLAWSWCSSGNPLSSSYSFSHSWSHCKGDAKNKIHPPQIKTFDKRETQLRKEMKKRRAQGNAKKLKNVSPFYRVKERASGGREGGGGGGHRSRWCGRGRKQQHRSELEGVWGAGWDLCCCKMWLFPPLWGSSCKPAPNSFHWADIYTVAQKQASFFAAAPPSSPSASQTRPKVRSIFFNQLLFIFLPLRPPALPAPGARS